MREKPKGLDKFLKELDKFLRKLNDKNFPKEVEREYIKKFFENYLVITKSVDGKGRSEMLRRLEGSG